MYAKNGLNLASLNSIGALTGPLRKLRLGHSFGNTLCTSLLWNVEVFLTCIAVLGEKTHPDFCDQDCGCLDVQLWTTNQKI